MNAGGQGGGWRQPAPPYVVWGSASRATAYFSTTAHWRWSSSIRSPLRARSQRDVPACRRASASASLGHSSVCRRWPPRGAAGFGAAPRGRRRHSRRLVVCVCVTATATVRNGGGVAALDGADGAAQILILQDPTERRKTEEHLRLLAKEQQRLEQAGQYEAKDRVAELHAVPRRTPAPGSFSRIRPAVRWPSATSISTALSAQRDVRS